MFKEETLIALTYITMTILIICGIILVAMNGIEKTPIARLLVYPSQSVQWRILERIAIEIVIRLFDRE